MKRLVALLSLVFLYINTASAQLAIIPQPLHVTAAKGAFVLKGQGVIGVDQESEAVGRYLQRYLLDTYALVFKVNVYQHIPLHTAIKLISNKSSAEGAYTLSVNSGGITIGGNGAGVFYGVQSLLQLMPQGRGMLFRVPACTVEDQPRFNWRGLSLDVSRHFFTVAEVEKYIDVMAHYKLNVFHWHLTDDEGWRIQIDKYPKLTEVGSKISYWAKQGKFRKLDNLVDDGRDGFYTKADIREVIKYAKDRYITILPEIEMPGHSEAAIFAYPELGCQDSTGAKNRVRMYDPSEHTFQFLEDVLSEVIELFPNDYIHIGGDEAEMDDWLHSPTAVALMKKEHLKNVREIQSYFIKRIEKFLLSKNKKLVGWDEILEGGLAESATVMSWRGEEGGLAAARMHHPVVMTPLPYMYFDAPQAKVATEPIGWNPPVYWQMVYQYEPVSASLAANETSYILGAQGNIWTEKVPNLQHLEYMVYPRALAVAELTWTAKENKNIDRFEQSMYGQYNFFKLWNLNARLPNVQGMEDLVTNKDNIGIVLKHPLKDARIQYTLDGTRPDTKMASKPFPLVIQAAVKDSLLISADVSLQGTEQHIFQTALVKQVTVNPSTVEAAGLKPGLNLTEEKAMLGNPAKGIKAVSAGTYLNGYLKISTEGDYRISTDFEISPAVDLDKQVIISQNKNKYVAPQSALLHLKIGYYQLRGYYPVNDKNKGQTLLVIKNAEGKLLDTAVSLFH
ncbi:beta-N-acetylhexosaminidase [Pedobacter sp. L105]|uniref:beta-N-acetylhexosaminidase n=1 Tax=Pedobacter sp. L105 TaxID=1641871 RepID=UPI00131C43B5|nr:beta-N-acetylhexosaminidase [Pedobacter sp. L105]